MNIAFKLDVNEFVSISWACSNRLIVLCLTSRLPDHIISSRKVNSIQFRGFTTLIDDHMERADLVPGLFMRRVENQNSYNKSAEMVI